MTPVDFRDALNLLDSALALIDRRDHSDPDAVRRRLRSIARELDLLRARLGQPAAELQRN
jgi:hypothetical protein